MTTVGMLTHYQTSFKINCMTCSQQVQQEPRATVARRKIHYVRKRQNSTQEDCHWFDIGAVKICKKVGSYDSTKLLITWNEISLHTILQRGMAR
jgi:hypothetical protein